MKKSLNFWSQKNANFRDPVDQIAFSLSKNLVAAKKSHSNVQFASRNFLPDHVFIRMSNPFIRSNTMTSRNTINM